jgi:hypothetical protein
MGARIDDNRTDLPIISGRIGDLKTAAMPLVLPLPTVETSPAQATDPVANE